MTVLVLGSASRGAVMWGATVGVLLLFVQRISFSRINRIVQVLALILISGLIVVYAARRFPVLEERIDHLKDRFVSLVDDMENTRIRDMSISARKSQLDFYRKEVRDWWLNGLPWYYGYPHNQWVEIAVRFGMLGLPFLIFSLWSVQKAVRRLLRGGTALTREELVVYTLFVFAYLQSMSSLSLQVNRALFLGFGYVLGAHVGQKEDATSRPGSPAS
jgi:O-antigen ligase